MRLLLLLGIFIGQVDVNRFLWLDLDVYPWERSIAFQCLLVVVIHLLPHGALHLLELSVEKFLGRHDVLDVGVLLGTLLASVLEKSHVVHEVAHECVVLLAEVVEEQAVAIFEYEQFLDPFVNQILHECLAL